MTINLITVLAPGNEKLNIEVDTSGMWTLRKNSTPNWRQYCQYPNGKWVKINSFTGAELHLYDANKQRCFSLFEWGLDTGKALCDKKKVHGHWVFTTKSKKADTTNLTVGLGFKAGGFLPGMPIVGGEVAAFLVYTPDQGTYVTAYGMPSVRLGLGGGASAGPVLAIIRGFESTSALHGFPVSGSDCNIALGTDVNSAFGPGGIRKIATFFDSLRQSAWNLNPENWEALLTMVKNVVNDPPDIETGIIPDLVEFPSVAIWDIPYAGAGAELSFFHMGGIMFKMDFLTFSQWMAEKAKTQQ